MKKTEFNLEKAKAGAKLVTWDGRPARIVCWDRLGTAYKILALVQVEEREEIFSYTIDGKFYCNNDSSVHDLCILEESVVRPYDNPEELLNSMKEYGPMVKHKDSNQFYALLEFNDEKVFIGGYNYSYSELQDLYTWQDGSLCGVCEEDTNK